MSNIKKFVYKICIVGNGGVGKTSIVQRYTDKSFNENYIMTVGSNFSEKYIEFPEFPDYKISLLLWDLAGQERFSCMRPLFYQGTRALIYVFDLTRRDTFIDLINWKIEVDEIVGSIPRILVGNKLDLAKQGMREITNQEADAIKEQLNACVYFETSAKDGSNINKVFNESTRLILNHSYPSIPNF